MKRSEMLDIITDCLNGNFLLSDDILSSIEKAGMAPPYYDVIQNNNGEKILIPCRMWEKEDE